MQQAGLMELKWNERRYFPYLLYLPVLISFGFFGLDRPAVEELYLKTLSGFEKAGDKWGLAFAKFQYAQVLHYIYHDMVRMKVLLDECYQLFRSYANPWGVALSLNGLANSAYLDGDYDAMIHYALESQEIYDETGDHWHMVDNYFKLGMASVAKGAYSRAREYYEVGLTVIRDLGSRFVLSAIFDSIGYVDYIMGDYAEAEAAYQESLAASQSSGDEHNQGMALQNIGDVLRAQGEWQQAGEHYRRSIELLGKDVDYWEQAMVWKKLGIVYRETGDHSRAKDSLIKALSLAGRGSSIPETLNVLIEIAWLLRAEGDLEKAVEILDLCSRHPGLPADSKDKLEQMFGIIRAESTAALSQAALQRLATRQLTQIVDELLSAMP
jgi:tetratricopeptide (TPR) repeat protein